jgi:opacity protein-like surface antigen
MKRIFLKYKTVLIALVICMTSGSSIAQDIRYEVKHDTIKIKKTRILRIVTVRTVPKFILQVNTGYNAGALELTGHNGGFSRDDFRLGKTFGARNGYGFNATGKLPLHKKGNFWLNVTSGFNRFESDLMANNTEEGRATYNTITAGVGGDYNFTPADRVKYFVGAHILTSIISGDARLIFYNPGSEINTTVVDLDINSAFRLGYSLYAGLEYSFEKNVGINFGFKFTHANLLLKKSTDQTVPGETELNDDAVNPSIVFAGWKQFAYSTIFGGVSFYFGVKEKKYRLP